MDERNLKSKIADLGGALFTVAITGLGFALGSPLWDKVLVGVRVSLGAFFLKEVHAAFKEKWLNSKNGIFNPDLQEAFLHAFVKSLGKLQNDFFKNPEYSHIPENEKESIRALFHDLKRYANGLSDRGLRGKLILPHIQEILYSDLSRSKLCQVLIKS